MAATTKKAAGAGFRHCRIYALDSNGLGVVPAGDADTAYDGLHFDMAKALTPTIPDPTVLAHTGDDKVGQIDLLPPTEAVSFEMRTGHTNLEIDALVSNINVVDLADIRSLGVATDQQGKEPDVLILAYRQSVDTDSGTSKGARRWNWILLPKAVAFAKAAGFEEGGADENSYNVQPRVVSQYPWLIDFACTSEGFLTTQLLKGIAEFRPHIAYWEGDGTEVAFDFTLTAAAITKVKVFHWVLSTETSSDVTGTVTITVNDITFASAPAAGDIVIAFYEIADAVC
jgi:hypothetical protein